MSHTGLTACYMVPCFKQLPHYRKLFFLFICEMIQNILSVDTCYMMNPAVWLLRAMRFMGDR